MAPLLSYDAELRVEKGSSPSISLTPSSPFAPWILQGAGGEEGVPLPVV